MLTRSTTSRIIRPTVSRVIGAGGGGVSIPSALRQLLYPGNQPAYYTEEEFAGYSHLLKDYSSGVGSLRPKRLGYCYDFDGVNDYVDIESLGTRFTADYSIVGWFYIDTLKFSGLAGRWVANQGWLCFLNSNGTLRLYRDSSIVATTTVLSTGQWYHIAFVARGSTGEIYLNGALDKTEAFAQSTTTISGSTSSIGAYGGSVNVFDGKISDPHLYNDALTADEVTYLYTNGLSGIDPGKANLVAHYPLQEESETIAYDISGNDNHGTITNAVTSGVGSIHQPDAGVTKSYPNDEGYRLSSGVYIPAKSATLAADGNALTETGEVPRYGTALGYGWERDAGGTIHLAITGFTGATVIAEYFGTAATVTPGTNRLDWENGEQLGPFRVGTDWYYPIPGTRDVAKVVSNGQGSVISDAVVNGVLADLYTIGDGSWRLPHIENGAHWDGTALYPAGPGQANAVNGEAINIPANVGHPSWRTDRTGGTVAPLDYAMGTDGYTDEAFDDTTTENTVDKRRANSNYSDRYGAALTDISGESYFDA